MKGIYYKNVTQLFSYNFIKAYFLSSAMFLAWKSKAKQIVAFCYHHNSPFGNHLFIEQHYLHLKGGSHQALPLPEGPEQHSPVASLGLVKLLPSRRVYR